MDVVTLAAARHYTNKKIGEMGAGGGAAAYQQLYSVALTEEAAIIEAIIPASTEILVFLGYPMIGTTHRCTFGTNADEYATCSLTTAFEMADRDTLRAERIYVTPPLVQHEILWNGYKRDGLNNIKTLSGGSAGTQYPSTIPAFEAAANTITTVRVGLNNASLSYPSGTKLEIWGR